MLQTKDDPDQIADETFEYLLFGKQSYYAYPVIGFEEDVAALRNKDVVDFYNISGSVDLKLITCPN